MGDWDQLYLSRIFEGGGGIVRTRGVEYSPPEYNISHTQESLPLIAFIISYPL